LGQKPITRRNPEQSLKNTNQYVHPAAEDAAKQALNKAVIMNLETQGLQATAANCALSYTRLASQYGATSK